MKLYHENIHYQSSIVVIKEERFPYNEFPFHYHSEYEIIHILKGSGKRFVGDNISQFDSGDLFFFGPNLAHTFFNKHLSENRDIHQIVIQFNKDFLGKDFFSKPPFKFILEFLDNSFRGYTFSGKTLEKASQKIIKMIKMDESAMIIHLLSILDLLSKSSEYTFISSTAYSNLPETSDSEKMNRVYNYIFENFKREITLNEIASVACLSHEAFCRYFKKYARKTFSEFLTEARIGYACRLLQEHRHGVGFISEECGFNNVSYFNRKFKAITSKTPLEYQKSYSLTEPTTL